MQALPEVLAPAHLPHRRLKAVVLHAPQDAVAPRAHLSSIVRLETVLPQEPVNQEAVLNSFENQTVGRFKPAGSFFNLSWTRSGSTV